MHLEDALCPPLQAAGDQEPLGDSQEGALRGTPLTTGVLLPPATPLAYLRNTLALIQLFKMSSGR